MVDASLASSLVVEELDLFEETGFTVGVKTWTGGGVDRLHSEIPDGNLIELEWIGGLPAEREILVNEDCMQIKLCKTTTPQLA